jgi:SAM-dependent methyltransferase
MNTIDKPATGHARLGAEDFAGLFGVQPGNLPKPCLDLIDAGDWRYRALDGPERDAVVLDLLSRIEQRNFSMVDPADKSRWIRGWGENLRDFVASSGAVESLAPKYIRPNLPLRLNQQFVKAEDSRFELHWYRVFQEWLFRAYLEPFDTIYEFGCGSGINVALLAQMFPGKKIVGLDWAEPSRDLVNEMRRLRGWNTEGRLFDFFNPDESLKITPNSAVLTVGALEQTGTGHAKFIDYLLQQQPALCVFIEPTYDWYDAKNLVDFLAIRIHDLRNFWKGFPERLGQLEKAGKAQIIKQKRAFFGSLLLEGYSQTVWKPL